MLFIPAPISVGLLCLSCFVLPSFGFVSEKANAAPTRTRTRVAMSPPFRATASLTSAGARVALEAAEREAELHGWGVCIVVADAGGVPLRAGRGDGAFPASYEVAAGKARTAALFRKPTGALEDAVDAPDGSRKALLSAPFVLMRGGVPIVVDGTCVGAVGVSGVKPHEDEQVALASVKALLSGVSKL